MYDFVTLALIFYFICQTRCLSLRIYWSLIFILNAGSNPTLSQIVAIWEKANIS